MGAGFEKSLEERVGHRAEGRHSNFGEESWIADFPNVRVTVPTSVRGRPGPFVDARLRTVVRGAGPRAAARAEPPQRLPAGEAGRFSGRRRRPTTGRKPRTCSVRLEPWRRASRNEWNDSSGAAVFGGASPDAGGVRDFARLHLETGGRTHRSRVNRRARPTAFYSGLRKEVASSPGHDDRFPAPDR